MRRLDDVRTSGGAVFAGARAAALKVSVVTVCFNSGRTIGHTLESFFAQTHAAKELVLVDGGSTDDTLRIVESFASEDMLMIVEPDRGIYDAMNKGIAAYTGDALGFLNSDDRYKDRHALAAIADTLTMHDIAYGDLDVVRSHEDGDVIRRWRSGTWRLGAFRAGWMPPHPTFYCRRRVIDAVGPFDLRYRVAADYDHMLRAMELFNFRVGSAGRVLVDMLHGGASSSGLRARVHHNLEALHSRRRWLGSWYVDAALIAKPLRKLSQFKLIQGGV